MAKKNTPKLTADQREDRKQMKAALKAVGGAMFTFPERGIVVVVVPALHNRLDSKFVHFTIAQCSEQDNFRVKVGQHMALSRWYADGVTMSRKADKWTESINLASEAYEIAEFFSPE